MTMSGNLPQTINVGKEANLKMENTTDKKVTHNHTSIKANKEISTMTMTEDKPSTSGSIKTQVTATTTEKIKPDYHEALKLDEVAGRSIGISKQQLNFMTGHQLIQMAEMKIVTAHNKNQTSIGQSHTKHSFNISRFKKSVERDKPKQEVQIKN